VTAYLKAVPAGVEVLVLVQPRASRTRVMGEHDGRLKIALAAPPVDGAANAELIEFFGSLLGLRKADVELLDGATGRRKRLLLRGVASERVEAVISAA
jgi:uncharacterized protein